MEWIEPVAQGGLLAPILAFFGLLLRDRQERRKESLALSQRDSLNAKIFREVADTMKVESDRNQRTEGAVQRLLEMHNDSEFHFSTKSVEGKVDKIHGKIDLLIDRTHRHD